jgi:PKHD-type hydroxylase
VTRRAQYCSRFTQLASFDYAIRGELVSDITLRWRLYASFAPEHGGLSSEQVNALIESYDDASAVPAYLGSSGAHRIDVSLRSARIRWMNESDFHQQLLSHLFTLAVVANRNCGWNFELRGMARRLQLTRYSSSNLDHFDWHMDWGADDLGIRKISLVVHLSEPSRYKGGGLHLMTGRDPVAVEQQAGTVTVFPSFVLHRATPVVDGERYVLVGWAAGSPFS